MTLTEELRSATDDKIDAAIRCADPMVLRGLLFQATGDERLMSMAIANDYFGYAFVNRIEHDADIELLRDLAGGYLRECRDTGTIPFGPPERLFASLSLTCGSDLPADEKDIWLEQAAFDPWARGLDEDLLHLGAQSDFTVGVIGSGLSGLNAAAQLKRAGIAFAVLEKNTEVGGTWWENHYPGARVDSPSRIYSHIFGAAFTFPNMFCPRDVNMDYMRWVVDSFDLRPHISFDTEVVSLEWREELQQWRVVTRQGDGNEATRHFNAIISCVGFLSRPNMVDFPGIDQFQGTAFHTARWPDGLDLANKRVGVIGSGATSYQLLPEIARSAGHVTLFQRTPSWCFENPTYLKPLPDEAVWLERNFPYYVNYSRLRYSSFFGPDKIAEATRIDPDFVDPHTISAINKEMRDICVAFVSRKLASRPELIAKMIPDFPPMSSRPIMVDDEDSVLDALTRDDVALVTDPIERVTETGVVAGGKFHSLDIIVRATGFRANDFLWPMKIVGRNGRDVDALWAKDGARAYLGSMLPGFPNFFMAYGPNTNNNGGFQYIDLMEIEVRFALQCIASLLRAGKRSVDVTDDAYWRFNAELDREEKKMVYMDPRAHSYWTTGKGRSATNGPIDFRRMWRWLRDPGGEAPAISDAGIEPYFERDLMVD